jgi:hypothetical protein
VSNIAATVSASASTAYALSGSARSAGGVVIDGVSEQAASSVALRSAAQQAKQNVEKRLGMKK